MEQIIHPCGRVRSAEGFISAQGTSPRSDMAALPQTGEATLPLRQLALSTLLCTCGNRTPCYASYSLSTSLVIALTEVIPIAIYHCNISISRGKGKSAVAAAAYRSRIIASIGMALHHSVRRDQ